MLGEKSWVLRMPPVLSTTGRMGKPPKPGFQPNPWAYPYPHPMRGISFASLPSGSEQARQPVVGSHFPQLQEGPNKALPELLAWPPVSVYWSRKAEDPGRYQGAARQSRGGPGGLLEVACLLSKWHSLILSVPST